MKYHEPHEPKANTDPDKTIRRHVRAHTPKSLSSLLVMKPRKIACIGTARLPFAKSARFSSRNMFTSWHTLLDGTMAETVGGLQRRVSSTAI